ncbi:Tartrate-resistant acid phosphatase type 5 [Seminavis robusta]|uniref:acid phosphatase n=1 Tax=Seminavis robusta TaxID=568900 RepID=A0A9N8HSY4_9STRA|nr:Tartrate-resistant acid phosphatase type 5 [Seminavis robusta]|eukprot:Sro1507_g278340.1 Tartrate-resistant acid phosphatase type 5 (418) ;mRNA; f:12040-13293
MMNYASFGFSRNSMRAVVALAFLLVPVVASQPQPQQKHSILNFFAIGDWGGVGSIPGAEFFIGVHQREVADGMNKVAMDQRPEFVVALGDNFYLKGISGQQAFQRVEKTFENVYNGAGLARVPWYVIAGNHDHYGNVTEQIHYTYYSRRKSKTEEGFHHRWEFPSLYHKRTITRGHLSVDLILIDTVDLVESAFLLEPNATAKSESLWDTWVRSPLGFTTEKEPPTTKQWQWLQKSLSDSTADYILVGGHYPVFSQGMHGPTKELVQHLKPLLEEYGAHYLSGHDHAMMHFQQNAPASGGVRYIVTGTGNACCSWRRNKYRQEHEKDYKDVPLLWHLFHQEKHHDNGLTITGGFVSIQATPLSMKVQYHAQDGSVLYRAEPIPPVPRRQQSLPDGPTSKSENMLTKDDKTKGNVAIE